MNEETLLREYRSLCKDVKKIYVVPLINFSFKKTNYLYLLYKNFIEEREKYKITIESLSAFSHPKLLLSKLKNEKSLLHYHWLEIHDLKSLAGMMWKLFWISLYKIFNGKIIWTIHNKFPHTNRFVFLNKIIRNYMAHLSYRLQVHCSSAIDIMVPVLNVERGKFFIIPHPEFPVELMDKNKAVYFLNQKFFPGKIFYSDKLFLMFGEIAEYKGIEEVIEIFNNLDENKKLIIAGTVKKGNKQYFENLILKIKNKNQTLIENKRILDEDVPVFFNSCEYALFNFREVLTSGSVKLALDYNKKILIPSMGCLQELQGENITHFKNFDELRNLLINC